MHATMSQEMSMNFLFIPLKENRSEAWISKALSTILVQEKSLDMYLGN